MSDEHDHWRQRVLGFDSLPSSEMEPVFAHLATCPACRAMREEQLVARREGRPYPPPAPAESAAPPPPETVAASAPAPKSEPVPTPPPAPEAKSGASNAESKKAKREARREAKAAAAAEAKRAQRAAEWEQPAVRPLFETPVSDDVPAKTEASAPVRPDEPLAVGATAEVAAGPAKIEASTPVSAAPAEPATPVAASVPGHRPESYAPPQRRAGDAPKPAAPAPRMVNRPAPRKPRRSRREPTGWEPLQKLVLYVVLPTAALVALVAWFRHVAGPEPLPAGKVTTVEPASMSVPERPVAPTPTFGALDLRLERYAGAQSADGGWHDGDPFELRFTLSRAAQVVVWRVRPSGEVLRVHPPVGAAGAARHGAGEVVLPPLASKETWAFDDQPGPETFVVAIDEQGPVALSAIDAQVEESLKGVTDRVARLELLDTVLREHFGPASRLEVEHLP